MRKRWQDEGGAVAVIFGVLAVPFIALAGWGVDYLRLHHVRDYLQTQADAAALAATIETDDWGAVSERLQSLVRTEALRQYGSSGWAENVRVRVEQVPGVHSDFRVTASADVPLAFMHIVPGIPDHTLVSVVAVARLLEIEYDYQPPEMTELDPEAGDFNRIWLYCFWPERPENDPDLPRRTQMVPIADNGGSVFVMDRSDPMLTEERRMAIEAHPLGLDGREKGIWRIASFNGNATATPIHADTRGERSYLYRLPDCARGSYQSLRLENVRFARAQPRYWDEGVPPGQRHEGRFNYYSDSQLLEDGTEFFHGLTMHHSDPNHRDHLRKVDILETYLCDTLEECVSAPQGVLPTGRNRTPERESRACEPGKFMYYGWEDRPPGLSGANGSWEDYAWTDRDYDDIRIVVPCPVPQRPGERNVRLIG